MKITFMALHLGFGGVEKYIITIANMLCEKYDVEIVATYKMSERPSFSLDDRVQVKYLLESLRPNKKELGCALKCKNLVKIIKESYRSYKILSFKKSRNIKAIQSLDCDVVISTRDFHNELIQKYANDKIVKITSEHNHHNNDEKYINRIVKSCNGFDYMLPISKELTLFYQEKLEGVDVRYIPFCIEKPSVVSNPTFEKPVFISVGRLSPEKGTFELINIFEKIHNKQDDAILHLVGDGPLMDDVKNKIKQKKLENNVNIHGFLRRNEIEQLYSESSIYLMTSYTESFGFVLLEAMSCGLPCVAFDSAQGANEIIKNEENGYLIADRNDELYVDIVLDLYVDKVQMKQMSKCAKECVNEYSYENTRNGWLALMNEIEAKI